MLRSSIDGDGRIRTSFNIAGTDTGRFSSYVSSFGSGSNLQTVTPELRKIFISDEGYKLDTSTWNRLRAGQLGAIEWNLFQDGKYLDACKSSDLHTTVARMCFKSLPWTGNIAQDKIIAKGIFYRRDDYRQGSKKMSHATNCFGKTSRDCKTNRYSASLSPSLFQLNTAGLFRRISFGTDGFKVNFSKTVLSQPSWAADGPSSAGVGTKTRLIGNRLRAPGVDRRLPKPGNAGRLEIRLMSTPSSTTRCHSHSI